MRVTSTALVPVTLADGPNGTNLMGLVKRVPSADWPISDEPLRPSGEALPWFENGTGPKAGTWAPPTTRAG